MIARCLGILAATAVMAAAPAFGDEPAAEPASDATATADEALPFKLSLPTEEDIALWRHTGFRIELGAGSGRFQGLFGAPSGRSIGAALRVGARVDQRWSLLGSFQYQVVTSTGGINGLRFAGTLDPTWHVGDHWQLAVGFGFGGMVEGNSGRKELNPTDFTSLPDSYTYLSAKQPITSCNGIGIASLGRIGWQQVLGPLSALTFYVEADAQWTQCEQRIGRVDPDTARPFIRRQYWLNLGGHAGMLFGWH